MGDKGGNKGKDKDQKQKAIKQTKDLKEKKDKQPKSTLKQGAGFNRQKKEEEGSINLRRSWRKGSETEKRFPGALISSILKQLSRSDVFFLSFILPGVLH